MEAGGAFDDLLARKAVAIMDGGMGSTLEDRGVDVRNDLWGSIALVTPEGRLVNDQAHQDFVARGAEILIANTHNASLRACETFLAGGGIEHVDRDLADYLQSAPEDRRALALFEQLNQEAVASARRSGAQVVAAGIGSAEGAYARASSLSPDEVVRRQEPQAELLASLDIDLLIFETLTTRSELEGLAALMRRRRDLRVPFALGLTAGENGRTLAGVTMEESVRMFDGAPPAIAFVQCTRFDLVSGALRPLVRALGDRCPAGGYGNDGRRWVDRRWQGERISPEAYASVARGWVDDGAVVIGGCCGTGPAHIQKLAETLPRARPGSV